MEPPLRNSSAHAYQNESKDEKKDRSFSFDEIERHCTPDDCWIVVHGVVYDVSNYLDKHPGGVPLVMKCAGKDATRDFEAMYHSTRARGILESLRIGSLDSKSRASLGSHLNPYNAAAGRPGTAKGTGPYGLGAYDPKKPLSRVSAYTPPPRPAIDQLAWRTYTLLRIEPVNYNTSIFRFQIPHGAKLNLGLGKHLSLGVNQNGKMIKREYTPISDKPGYFELIVKKYPGGIGSNHLHNLKVGEGALMRGLYGTLEVKPEKWSKLFMFAAGTGIAPMIPFLQYFADWCKHNQTSTKTDTNSDEVGKRKAATAPKLAEKIHLVFSNKTKEDILLKETLESLEKDCKGSLTIDFLISQITEQSESDSIMQGRLSEKHMETISHKHKDAFTDTEVEKGPIESTFALICGPDDFVTATKALLENQWKFTENQYHAF